MTKVRTYRRGREIRTNDILLDEFKRKLGFKVVEFNKSYTEDEKQQYLNQGYDAFIDLSDILQVNPTFLSMKHGEEPLQMYFGDSAKVHNNIVMNKEGRLGFRWFRTLDRCIGLDYNFADGFIKNITQIGEKDELSKNLLSLLDSIIYKDTEVFNTEELNAIRLELEDVLEKMPVSKTTIEEMAIVEDSRTRFIKELTKKRLFEMFDTFEKYNVNLGELKGKLLDILHKAEIIQEGKPSNIERVETDFFKGIKADLGEDYLFLASLVFESYMVEKQKETNSYNNFLVTGVKENAESLYPNDAEKEPMIEEMGKYLSTIINMYSDKFIKEIAGIESIESNDDTDETSNLEDFDTEEDTRTSIIDNALSNDKGKFKITLFRKLAKEFGLNIANQKVEKGGNGQTYYIYVDNSVVKYIRVPIYSSPLEDNHCINIYIGKSGDVKEGYWWDKELDYVDLIKKLLDIDERLNAKKKFRITYFKDLCKQSKLSLVNTAAEVYKDCYVIRFNGFVTSIITPIYLDLEKKDVQINSSLGVKNITQEKDFDYEGIVKAIEDLENKIRLHTQEQIDILNKQRDKEQKIFEDTKKEYDEYKNEIEKKKESLTDCSNIETTKDLRTRLNQYVNLYGKTLDYPKNIVTVISVLRDNFENKEGVSPEIIVNTVPEKCLRGNSKSWGHNRNYGIVILRSAEERKKVEGLVEAFVDSKIKNKYGDHKYETMLKETITFMICRKMGLDVRTYCTSKDFDKLVKMTNNKKANYLSKSFKMYDELITYFV